MPNTDRHVLAGSKHVQIRKTRCTWQKNTATEPPCTSAQVGQKSCTSLLFSAACSVYSSWARAAQAGWRCATSPWLHCLLRCCIIIASNPRSDSYIESREILEPTNLDAHSIVLIPLKIYSLRNNQIVLCRALNSSELHRVTHPLSSAQLYSYTWLHLDPYSVPVLLRAKYARSKYMIVSPLEEATLLREEPSLFKAACLPPRCNTVRGTRSPTYS